MRLLRSQMPLHRSFLVNKVSIGPDSKATSNKGGREALRLKCPSTTMEKKSAKILSSIGETNSLLVAEVYTKV